MMKRVQLFYLKHCPYCKAVLQHLAELMQEKTYAQVEIEWIEESERAELAADYDYYYVPCFYVDGIKVKEGVLHRSDVLEVLEMAVK